MYILNVINLLAASSFTISQAKKSQKYFLQVNLLQIFFKLFSPGTFGVLYDGF